MKTKLISGILVVLCSACASMPNGQEQAPPAPHGEVGALTASTGICDPNTDDGTTFAKQVHYLDPTFDPTTFYDPAYITDPPAPLSTPVPGNITNDLKLAFQYAPVFFKKHLCNRVNAIYIDSTGRDSWGYRNPNSNHRFIAISSSLWSSGGAAQNLSTYETLRIQRLTSTKFYFKSAVPDDSSGMTVLAALAHEYGHILWNDITKADPRKPRKLAFLAGSSCFDKFFKYWEQPLQEPPTWRSFGDLNSIENEHVGDVDSDNVFVSDIENARHNDTNTKAVIKRLYESNGRWASFLGSFSPDEDLVEMFQLVVLKKAKNGNGLKSLPLYYEGDEFLGDIPMGSDIKRFIRPKTDCF